MIAVESVTRTYGAFTAVDIVSFTAQPGSVTGFLGPDGAGKSTTMRIIVGPTRGTSGTATVAGHSYADLPRQRVEERLELVSLTPEEASRRVRDYSLGMQRLGIVTALIGEPEVPILDEPANFLDPAAEIFGAPISLVLARVTADA